MTESIDTLMPGAEELMTCLRLGVPTLKRMRTPVSLIGVAVQVSADRNLATVYWYKTRIAKLTKFTDQYTKVELLLPMQHRDDSLEFHNLLSRACDQPLIKVDRSDPHNTVWTRGGKSLDGTSRIVFYAPRSVPGFIA